MKLEKFLNKPVLYNNMLGVVVPKLDRNGSVAKPIFYSFSTGTSIEVLNIENLSLATMNTKGKYENIFSLVEELTNSYQQFLGEINKVQELQTEMYQSFKQIDNFFYNLAETKKETIWQLIEKTPFKGSKLNIVEKNNGLRLIEIVKEFENDISFNEKCIKKIAKAKNTEKFLFDSQIKKSKGLVKTRVHILYESSAIKSDKYVAEILRTLIKDL